MIRWTGSTTRRYSAERLSLGGTREPRPFTGTPIRAVRRPLLEFTGREIAGAIALALLMVAGGLAWTIVLLAAAGR